VIAIELSPEAAYDAKMNSQRLGVTNFTIHTGDVAHVLKEKRAVLPKADVVIVDPPRSGLTHDAIIEIMTILPRTIVYVSCNPVTQVENIAAFAQFGYHVTHLQPVDQFPQTPHVENIVICRRF
jgi:23S rRNA (uracil1939-C5)-methyltransferase